MLKFQFTFFLLLLLSSLSAQQDKYKYLLPAQIDQRYGQNVQKAALQYSYIGEYEKAVEVYGEDQAVAFTKEQTLLLDKKYEVREAINFITQKSINHQITILNEAHHQPRHRFFVRKLLDAFCDQGYTHLALEALCHYDGNMCDVDLKDRKFPLNSFKTGVLTREPQFGNLLREAIEMGYEIVSYESTNHADSNEREINQAKNITRVFEKDPRAKVLIFCGYNHLIEKKVNPTEHGGKEKWMAGYLKKMTGIDPLTINQIPLTESKNNENLFDYFKIKQSIVFINKENIADIYNRGNEDIMVAHPSLDVTSGRPEWMQLPGFGLFLIEKELSALTIKPPFLVEAYKASELASGTSPVPLDIIQVREMGERRALFLPISERVILRIFDTEGEREEVEIFTGR